MNGSDVLILFDLLLVSSPVEDTEELLKLVLKRRRGKTCSVSLSTVKPLDCRFPVAVNFICLIFGLRAWGSTFEEVKSLPDESKVPSSLASSMRSQRNRGLKLSRKIARSARGSSDQLCPIVMDSHVPPRLCMDEAWLTARQVDASEVVKAVRRPSGRPHKSKLPRTTRCVWRCTK